MQEGSTFVGLDAHAVENQAAMLLPGGVKAVEREFANARGGSAGETRDLRGEPASPWR